MEYSIPCYHHQEEVGVMVGQEWMWKMKVGGGRMMLRDLKKIKNNYFEIINTIFLYIFGDTNRIIQTHTAVLMLTRSLAKRQYFRQNTPNNTL